MFAHPVLCSVLLSRVLLELFVLQKEKVLGSEKSLVYFQVIGWTSWYQTRAHSLVHDRLRYKDPRA
jgi:hypothetical protein